MCFFSKGARIVNSRNTLIVAIAFSGGLLIRTLYTGRLARYLGAEQVVGVVSGAVSLGAEAPVFFSSLGGSLILCSLFGFRAPGSCLVLWG